MTGKKTGLRVGDRQGQRQYGAPPVIQERHMSDTCYDMAMLERDMQPFWWLYWQLIIAPQSQ